MRVEVVSLPREGMVFRAFARERQYPANLASMTLGRPSSPLRPREISQLPRTRYSTPGRYLKKKPFSWLPPESSRGRPKRPSKKCLGLARSPSPWRPLALISHGTRPVRFPGRSTALQPEWLSPESSGGRSKRPSKKRLGIARSLSPWRPLANGTGSPVRRFDRTN